jgi:hypothetical protein
MHRRGSGRGLEVWCYPATAGSPITAAACLDRPSGQPWIARTDKHVCTSRAAIRSGGAHADFRKVAIDTGALQNEECGRQERQRKPATQPNRPPSPHSSSNNTEASSNSAGTFRRYGAAVVERRGHRLLLMGDGWQCRNFTCRSAPLSGHDAEFQPGDYRAGRRDVAGRFRHNGNPLLTWCVGNVVGRADQRGTCIRPRAGRIRKSTQLLR